MTDAVVQVDHGSEAVCISVTGEIDMDNAGQVEQQILGAISNQLATVTLDLSGLDYLDSAGLRVLFTLGARLETLQMAARLIVPAESPVRRVVDLAGMGAIIPVSCS